MHRLGGYAPSRTARLTYRGARGAPAVDLRLHDVPGSEFPAFGRVVAARTGTPTAYGQAGVVLETWTVVLETWTVVLETWTPR